MRFLARLAVSAVVAVAAVVAAPYQGFSYVGSESKIVDISSVDVSTYTGIFERYVDCDFITAKCAGVDGGWCRWCGLVVGGVLRAAAAHTAAVRVVAASSALRRGE